MMVERRRGDGLVYQRPNNAGVLCWYIRWWQQGKDRHLSVAAALRKPPEQVTRQHAEKLLRKMVRARLSPEALPGPKVARVTVRMVTAAYRTHLEFKGQMKLQKLAHLPPHLLERKQKSLRGTLREVDTLDEWVGDEPIVGLTQRLEAIQAELLKTYQVGTLRSRFALLHAACRHAAEKGLIPAVPLFPKLEGRHVRQGTISLAEHERIQRHLPGDLDRDVTECLRLSGWRPGEPPLLTWSMYRSEPVPHFWLPLTKTDEGKPLLVREAGIVALIARRRAARRLGCEFVFHRDGRPVMYSTLWKHWAEASAAAGLPEKNMHDYRRSRYDQLDLAGVEDENARGLVGHKSLRVASDYNVKHVLRLWRALDRVVAREHPRNTRASETGEEGGSPL